MKLSEYLKDKVYFIIVNLICISIIILLLLAFKVRFSLIMVVTFLLITENILLLMIDYFRKKNFYTSLIQKLEELDKKYLILEMMSRPSFYEGKILYDTIYETDKSMIENVNEYLSNIEDFKDYIEMWIHEVKTPLAAAKLILENHPSEITEAMDEALQQINYYLEQALYYARSNSVEKDYLVKELNLKDMVQKAVRSNARIMISNKIKISMNNLDQKIFSDEKWLLFILNQIISNAVKYKKEDPQISFEARQSTNQIFLEIRDNGIGIAAKDLPRVTDKGYTGTTGRNYEKSTGMGLYLCKKLCDKLQLSFKIESKEEEYTIVTIGFPRSSMIFLNE